ncbi:SDR family oxidoreductase [Kribbella deserti]|uniref:SDR family oxidoreductase n=1 Tax=Kribbella deserti TaxID=1926257 RepID=A0ABV6QJZ6_9ACTN
MRRRNILITGASSGLGEEMARQFADNGHNLALTARRTERLEKLRDDLLKAYPAITVVVRTLDVNDHDQVFEVFRSLDKELDGLDRVIVNAGIGKGAPLGTGRFDANRDTLMTNLVAATAQCEAALELFRARNAGHLVVITSMSALRGMPKTITAYAASKAGIAAVAEGLRMEMIGKPIKVSAIYPGYIASEMNDRVAKAPLMTDTVTGVRSIVDAINKEKAKAYVPTWPYVPISYLMRFLPLPIVKRMI